MLRAGRLTNLAVGNHLSDKSNYPINLGIIKLNMFLREAIYFWALIVKLLRIIEQIYYSFGELETEVSSAQDTHTLRKLLIGKQLLMIVLRASNNKTKT